MYTKLEHYYNTIENFDVDDNEINNECTEPFIKKIIKKIGKSKFVKSVGKEAKYVAKSKFGKTVGKVGKQVGKKVIKEAPGVAKGIGNSFSNLGKGVGNIASNNPFNLVNVVKKMLCTFIGKQNMMPFGLVLGFLLYSSKFGELLNGFHEYGAFFAFAIGPMIAFYLLNDC